MMAPVNQAAPGTIAVGPDDTLLDVFDRVRAAGPAPLVITIPNQSALFLTAAEFRTLRDVAEHGRHSVTVRASDPHRLQLAKLLGFAVAVMPPPTPSPAPVKVAAAPGAAAPARPEPAPEPDAVSTVTAEEAAAVWPEAVAHQPVPGLAERWRDRLAARLAPPAPPTVEPEPSSPEPAVVDEVPATLDAESSAGPMSWVGTRRRPRPVVLIGAAVLAVLLWFGLNYLVPSATIDVRLAAMPINSTLEFDVTASGEPFDDAAAFAIAGMPRDVSISFQGAAPATGTRREPDGVAAGTVRFANPAAGEITVAAGTSLLSVGGAEFVVINPVAVPGVDPVTQRPGQADGAVRSAQGGTAGDVGIGEIGGRLENGVFYSNREEATTGGTDREIAVIAEAERETLLAQAAAMTPELVAAAIAAEDPDLAIVPPSIVVTGQTDQFDQEVGAAADSLALATEITVTVLVYDRVAASADLAEHLGGQLAATVPAGYSLGPVALDADDFVVVSGDAAGGRFAVDAEARANLAMSSDKERELAAALAGKSPADAATVLAAAPEVVDFAIVPGFQFFWSRDLPASPDRISFDVVD